MAAQPDIDHILAHLLSCALVHDGKVLGQPNQPRPLPDNVMGQTVQGTHPIADIGQQATTAHESCHASFDIFHRRVHQSDDQDLLIVVDG